MAPLGQSVAPKNRGGRLIDDLATAAAGGWSMSRPLITLAGLAKNRLANPRIRSDWGSRMNMVLYQIHCPSVASEEAE